jgi:tubulin polyglutamylase TTLL6/13
VEKLWHRIGTVVVRTIIPIQSILAHTYRLCTPDDVITQRTSMCFELLGFDIILDSHYNPHILEVNHSPSFSIDTPLDQHVKFNVVKDTVKVWVWWLMFFF